MMMQCHCCRRPNNDYIRGRKGVAKRRRTPDDVLNDDNDKKILTYFFLMPYCFGVMLGQEVAVVSLPPSIHV